LEGVGGFVGAARKYYISVFEVLTTNKSVVKTRMLCINFGSIMI
jgi:hypothetical protein